MSISNAPDTPDARTAIEQQILDAARGCVEEFGVKRTTLAEVARRAGVSRPTVYRRWPDTRALIADLLTREVLDTIVAATPPGGDARTRLVRAIVGGSAALRSHPLFDKLFRTDSDLMLTYIVERLGRSQHTLIELFAGHIRAGQAEGSVRSGNPVRLATMVLLIAQSAVQSARMVSDSLPPAHLHAELARAVDSYLRPQDPP